MNQTILEIKNSLQGLKSRYELAKETMNKLERQGLCKPKSREKDNEEKRRVLENCWTQVHQHLCNSSNRKEKAKNIQRSNGENFPTYLKATAYTPRNLKAGSMKRSTHRHIVSMLKLREGDNLESSKRTWLLTREADKGL